MFADENSNRMASLEVSVEPIYTWHFTKTAPNRLEALPLFIKAS